MIGPDDGKLTLRQFLLFKVLEQFEGTVTMAHYMQAVEAVSSTALANPSWDLDARQDWAGWEKWSNEKVESAT